MALQAPLKKLGFKFELRRRGELSLALWRLKFKKVPNPKRLVLIPGFGDSPLGWLGVLVLLWPRLRQEYDEVVLFDFPGFGGLYFDQPAFSRIDDLFDHCIDVINSLTPHTLVGHSLGGWIASTYSVHCEAKFKPKKLVLISPPSVMDGEHSEQEWKSRFDLALAGKYREFSAHVFNKAPWYARISASQMKHFFNKPEIREFMKSIRQDHLHTEELKNLPAETYLLWGVDDQINFYKWSKEWIRLAPETLQLISFPGVGHTPQIESPVRLAFFMNQILSGDSKNFRFFSKTGNAFLRKRIARIP